MWPTRGPSWRSGPPWPPHPGDWSPAGQRPVENLVGSPVSRRYGGMQPANTARREMFGQDAPVWPFLARFGGPANPLGPLTGTSVIETYPVLAMIALGWTLRDSRPTGRLPKYNPDRQKTFSISDWRHVCQLASSAFRERGLLGAVSRPAERHRSGYGRSVCLRPQERCPAGRPTTASAAGRSCEAQR